MIAALLSLGGAARAESPHREAEREAYLDRLMLAESGGRDDARNPRSTALGPYQFIAATFLEVARRHFRAEVGSLADTQLLALRTDRDFARRAANAYTDDCAVELAASGVPASYANLRLAFLLGPVGAIRVLQADPTLPVATLVGPAVMRANPFLATLTAAGLLARAAREAGESAAADGARTAPVSGSSAVAAKPALPPLRIACAVERPSCKRWIALARQKPARQVRIANR